MKMAISICDDCVSNVFDFASHLLLVEIESGKELSRSEVALESQSLPQGVYTKQMVRRGFRRGQRNCQREANESRV